MNRDSIRIGTSGWSYKEWEHVFYPDTKTPKLTFYSGIFNTAEIDSTFYANPSKGMVLGWVKNTPKDFEFSVKLPQTITHKKKLDLRAGAEIDLVDFLDLIDPLREAEKLGPILIQLPPSFGTNSSDNLEEFLKSLPHKEKDYMFAIEFRNKTWLNDLVSVNRLLSRYNVARTIVDEPLLPIDLTPTADFSFIRWHGQGTRPWYNYRYSKEELEPWVGRVKEQMKKAKKVYGYFNNHFHGYAIENSLEFLENLGIASEKQKQALSEALESIERKGARKASEKKLVAEGQKTLGEF
jgi:uncharacterized protein YecE (DUF72 family)